MRCAEKSRSFVQMAWFFVVFVAVYFYVGYVYSYSYHACAPGWFGQTCEGRCRCSEHEECNDGIGGDGTCVCKYGAEALCGLPQRLFPRTHFVETEKWTYDKRPLNNLNFVPLAPKLWNEKENEENCDALAPGHARWNFSINRWSLVIDKLTTKKTRQVVNATVTRILPTPFSGRRGHVLASNREACNLINLHPDELNSPEFVSLLTGVKLPAGSEPFAHCYGGHQVLTIPVRARAQCAATTNIPIVKHFLVFSLLPTEYMSGYFPPSFLSPVFS